MTKTRLEKRKKRAFPHVDLSVMEEAIERKMEFTRLKQSRLETKEKEEFKLGRLGECIRCKGDGNNDKLTSFFSAKGKVLIYVCEECRNKIVREYIERRKE